MFLFLLVFGLWVAFTTKQIVEQVQYSDALREDYDRAQHAISDEESLERKYRLEPAPEWRDRHQQAAAEVIDALQDISRDGRAEDRELASKVRSEHGRYLDATHRMFAAVDAGDTERVLAIDGEEVDPAFESIQKTVEGAAQEHYEEAQDRLADLDQNTRLIFNATPIAFAVVLLLLGLFGSVLRLYQRLIHQSEERFRSLVQNASDVILIMEADRSVRYISPAVERVLGYRPEEVMGEDNFTPVHPDDMARVEEVVAEAVKNPGTTFPVELRLRHAGGSWRLFESRCTSLLEDPAVGGIVFNFRDITERKRVEKKLQASETNLAQAQRIVRLGSWEYEPKENRVYWSDETYRIFGFTPQQFSPTFQNFLDAVHPDDRVLIRENMAKLMRGEQVQDALEFHIVRPDGEVRLVQGQRSVELDEMGGPIKILGTVQDITERRKNEDALRRSESRLAEAQRLARIGNWEWDTATDTAVWSEELYRIFGLDPRESEASYATHLEHVHPDDREAVKSTIRAAYRNRTSFSYETRIVRPDGKARTIHVRGKVVANDAGTVVRMFGTAQDVTEARLAEEQVRFQAHLLGQVQAAVIATDLVGTVTHWNEYAERLYGWSREEVLGRNVVELAVGPAEAAEEIIEQLLADETWEGEFDFRRKDGSTFPAYITASLVHDTRGQVVGMAGIAMDITERKRAEGELRKSEARNRAIIEATPDLLFRVSRDGECLDFQASDESMLYAPAGEIIGKNLRDLMPSDLVPPMLRRITKTLETGEMQGFEYQLPVAEGVLDFEARLVVSGPEEVLVIVRDVTERKSLERRLEHQAFHDALTGLPNRALLMDRIEHALTRVERHGESVAVLFMDLDNFKVINDSLGHETGDQLLAAVAERLRTCLRPQDTLARLGGDEFVVLLEDVGGVNGATGVAERAAEALRDPFALEGQEVFVTASIGIALGSSAHELPGALLRSADLAMYRAKDTGKARYVVFDPEMNELALKRLSMEGELRRALERNELRVYYQPTVRLDTNLQQHLRVVGSRAIIAPEVSESPRIEGFEALVRWEHPERGMILPVEFIPIAEESGLIIPMGRWVLKEACRQIKEWQEQHPNDPHLTISVNLSATQLRRPDLVEYIAEILQEAGLEADMLVLEITESILLEDARSNIRTIERLKSLGVQLAVDDFGTGYSSLSYLKHLPVDYLKIDKSFIAGLGRDSQDSLLVSGVINLAHGLGLKVVAEGVETAEQLAQVRAMGCDMAQGYYFAKPLPGETAERRFAVSVSR